MKSRLFKFLDKVDFRAYIFRRQIGWRSPIGRFRDMSAEIISTISRILRDETKNI